MGHGFACILECPCYVSHMGKVWENKRELGLLDSGTFIELTVPKEWHE